MGIKASDDLFQLIRSMTAAEKRAFRLLSERHSRKDGNNYLLLFDAIAAQTLYDELEIRQKFLGKSFLNNLSEAKSYLYEAILRGLRFTRGPESAETELREMLDHLEILHAKGLQAQAEKLLHAGLTKARELDLHAFTAEFHRWQRRLTKWRGGKALLTELAEIAAAEAQAIQNLAQDAHLRDLMGRIQIIFAQKVDDRNSAREAEMEALWADNALRRPPTEIGFHGLVSYHLAHAFYQRSQGKAGLSMEAWQSLVATYEAFPVQIKRQPDQYINSLASLLDARLNNMDLEPFLLELERLRRHKVKETNMVARIFFLEHHLSLRYALITGRLDQAMLAAPELEAGMTKFAKYLNASLELTLLYNLCALYFLAERYPEAQRYINLALNRPHLPLREDILEALRLLEMLARYARGQLDVLAHLHKSAERRLRQLTNKPPFGLMTHKLIGKLLDAADARETALAIKNIHAQLLTLEPEIKPTGFEELWLWVCGRLEGKRMVEVLRETYSKQQQEKL
jgi:hypothetical protein